ncbi:hypothetical protein G6L09_05705 [Agrobacterium rhizogenes]|jgi:hypothetical protein|nr:hypothetical protein [Rhizobium rhizogenes]NTH70053.1 hypothetical protein [Rhizobium rhizogenes]
MWNLIPTSVKVAIAIGVAIVISLAASWTYYKIYDRGYSAASSKYEAAEAKMVQANQAAIASAEKGLREDLATIAADKEKLDNENAINDSKANEDPDAHSGGIKRSGVQRLNAVR